MTGRPVRRRPRDLLWLVLGIVVLLAGAVPVHADRVEGLEASAFRLVNDLPSVPFFPVVTALAYVAWPWLPRWGRWAAGAAVAAVFLTRMYVGAHLPLDMVGGAALGLAVGGLVRLLLGVPAPAPDPADEAVAVAGDARKVA